MRFPRPSEEVVENVKDAAWRWKCKVLRVKDEKKLSDYDDSMDSADLARDAAGASSTPTPTPAPKDGSDGFGSALVVKTMYEGEGSNEQYINWKDYPPRQLSKSAARAQDRVAIKLFKVKDKSKPVIGGRFALRYHALDVQNPALVAALEPILAAEDHHLDVNETAHFHAPFRPLYFGYDAIVAKLRSLSKDRKETKDSKDNKDSKDGQDGQDGQQDSKDEALRPYLQLLVRVLDEVFAEVRTKRAQLAGRGLISFEHAWTYFPRGAVVRSFGHNCEVLSRVLDTAYVNPTPIREVLEVRTQVLRFNGEAFEWETQELQIDKFEGNKPLSTFDHCPLTHVAAADDVRRHLTARGRLVLDFQGLVYSDYTGVGIHRNEENKMEKHNVDGRILVDVVGYNKHHLARGAREGKDDVSAKNLVDGTGRPLPRVARKTGGGGGNSAYRRLPASRRRYVDEDSVAIHLVDYTAAADSSGDAKTDAKADGQDNKSSICRLTDEEQARNKATMLEKPDDLMFLSPVIEGYALKNKLWCSFFVEDIRPLEYNDQAYDHLVYDEQQKDLVLSFVENHGHTRSTMDDVIRGKGDGLIILLSGPPGTGKTLTAEAVADRTHRPLFYLQAEDLGVNAASLGANVKKVFEMATEWDAVILLDEADVFMAERHPQDIARNELVSIFLRELEYYRGIIFLTTNLYDTIDGAFRSRVSLHLLFRPLSPDARLTVWRKFLARVVTNGGASGERASGGEKDKTNGEAKDTADGEAADKTNGEANGVSADTLPGTLCEDDLQELSAWNLNGREIKTAVKMVTSWCDHKGHAMTLERMENGIRVTTPHASKHTPAGESDLYD